MNVKMGVVGAAIIAIVFLAIRELTHLHATTVGRPSPPSNSVVRLPPNEISTGTLPVTPPFAPRALNEPSIAAEVTYSTDLRSTYEKYKSIDDPDGAISYYLSKGLDECLPFIGKTQEQVASALNARAQSIDSPQRTRLIEQLVARCKGFGDWDRLTIDRRYHELQDRAAAAGYPAAVAKNLTTILAREGTQRSDAAAMSLLSGPVDGDVIVGLYFYLQSRNGNDWFERQGPSPATFSAWALLECNMGADCGDRSHWVMTACLYYGACDLHDVPTALAAMYPALDPGQLQQAIAIETALGTAIQNRDWVRLGFTYINKSADPTP